MQNEFGETILSPAYDLLSTRLLMTEDKEEMALTVNGKKARIKRKDFVALGKNLQIAEKAIDNCFSRLLKQTSKMKEVIKNSFLSPELQKRFNTLIDERAKTLQM